MHSLVLSLCILLPLIPYALAQPSCTGQITSVVPSFARAGTLITLIGVQLRDYAAVPSNVVRIGNVQCSDLRVVTNRLDALTCVVPTLPLYELDYAVTSAFNVNCSCVSLFYTKVTMAATLQIDKEFMSDYKKTPALLVQMIAAFLGLNSERVTATVDGENMRAQISFSSSSASDSAAKLKGLVSPVNTLQKFGIVAVIMDGATLPPWPSASFPAYGIFLLFLCGLLALGGISRLSLAFKEHITTVRRNTEYAAPPGTS